MKIREFEIDTDFDIIKDWITDDRTHAMWSANHLIYPLDKENLRKVLSEVQEMFGIERSLRSLMRAALWVSIAILLITPLTKECLNS